MNSSLHVHNLFYAALHDFFLALTAAVIYPSKGRRLLFYAPNTLLVEYI